MYYSIKFDQYKVMSFKNLYNQNKLYFLSFFSIFLCAIFSVGFFHPDEHYQLLEFANYKLGNIEGRQLPWEFHEKIRPTLQPILAFVTIKIFNLISFTSPFLIAFFLRLISSILSFYCLHKIFHFYSNEFKSEYLKKWFYLFTFFSWFLLFIGIRFSSENWSACIFTIGLIHFLSTKEEVTRKYLILGLFLGLAFLIRFQTAFFILGLSFWLLFVNQTKLKNCLFLILPFCFVVGMGILLDSWFYNSITITPFNYFYQNIVLNKAANFGVEPWWYYFKIAFEKGIPPISIIFILATIYFFIKNPKNPLTWISVPFILIHFMIGHKELRFLFPLFFFLPYFFIQTIDYLVQKNQVELHSKSKPAKWLRFLFVFNLIFYIIIIFRPMTTKVYLFDFLYNRSKNEKLIYFTDNNPFETIDFYKRNQLTIKKMDVNVDSNFITNNRGKLIITIPEKRDLFKKQKLIFQTYPDWLQLFNIGNWMGKSEQYFIYKI